MKGVSTVIAIILILMITVAMAALAYLWFTGVFETLTETGQEQVEETTIKLGSSIAIESVKGDNVYVRNTGKYNVTEIVLYIDDVLTEATVPETIEPGKVGAITLTVTITGEHRVKITSKYANAEGIFSFGNVITVCKSGECDSKTIQGGLYLAETGYVVKVTDANVYEESIVIPVNDLTLDCDGATIKSTSTNVIYLIELNDVVIENCNINGSYRGIYMESSSNAIIQNNILDSCGIYSYYSSNNIIQYNSVSQSSENGIYLQGGSNNKILNNSVVYSAAYGIALYSNQNGIISNNIACYQTGFRPDIKCSTSTYTGDNNVATNVDCPEISYKACPIEQEGIKKLIEETIQGIVVLFKQAQGIVVLFRGK
jgi:parallel beta-helix repeat protein